MSDAVHEECTNVHDGPPLVPGKGAIEDALALAARAGQWDVVRELAALLAKA